jgi:ribonuclease HI
VSPDRTTVYTDGACLGNPGPGGWAWAVPGGDYASGAEPASTNQRMEVTAALKAVTSRDGPLEVVSDSTYVVNCFRDRWWEGWLARGWVNSAKRPVANRDLWEPLINAYRTDPSRIAFRWVKGHSTDPINDLVDRLAVEAAAAQVGRKGTGWPEHLGPADLPAPAGNEGAPPGHLVVVTGVKPPELGGYGDNPTAVRVRDRLAEILAAKHQLHPDLTVLSGLGLGAEQLGAEAAASAGIPYVAVLAFPEPEGVWPQASRQHFTDLLGSADGVITLQRHKPATKQAAGGALARRDAWLARHGAEAIVVWNGEDPAVGRTVRSLQDHLGEDEVWVLEP